MKVIALILSLITASFAEVIERDVEYQHKDTTLLGFHAYDTATDGKRPGILIVHQWTGLTDYEKRRARMLAELGYNVFALDIYGKGIRPQPPASGKEAGKYKGNRKLFRERLHAGLDVLKGDSRTDPENIAAIGYCFGGTGVLELARSGAAIDGVVSFHGGLGAADGMAAGKGDIQASILVCHGAVDPHVSDEEVAGFQREMTEAGADWQFIAYSDAVHAFTQPMAGDDPSKGAAYQKKADERSWRHMQDFFSELFEE
ncbi:dienelactone hydrolase family protein [Haloferula rosea]|uniref:Dienelactone hydrolase family protein n=1 Tax=Haloferula rosea TaxID=490093 RepID=A0A934RG21_9BACT|nr:dienelactone hydrolase family protein [Haloferula rosea]MBK1828521.1 dienelactone hydrolase family protein [Haloferula rosea]